MTDSKKVKRDIRLFKADIKKALKGDADSQKYVGLCYYLGVGTPLDMKKALYWFKRASKQGQLSAHYYLGQFFLEGKYVEKNEDKALELIFLSAQQGNKHAQWRLGTMYEDGEVVIKHPRQALYWYGKAARQGVSNAIAKIGWAYYEGKHCPQNYEFAYQWFKKGVEKNNPSSQHGLGCMYLLRHFVYQDFREAIKLFEAAADQKYLPAIRQLARFYQTTSTRDDKKALHWCGIAAQLGDAEYQYRLGYINLRGLGKQQDYDEAKAYFRLSAEQNYPNGWYFLGQCYINGWGTDVKTMKARQCFEHAASLGVEHAKVILKKIPLFESDNFHYLN